MNPYRSAQFRITIATLSTLLAVFAAHAPAQAHEDSNKESAKPTTQKSSAPTIKVYSRETIVDITVTDAKGHPVHGLKQADFTIQQDGEPQSIRSFQEFANVAPAAAIILPPNTFSNRQTATGPLTILLLDDIYGGDRFQVRSYIEKFIRNMAPGTQVALLALGDRLTVLQEPTTDPVRLLKVAEIFVQPFVPNGDPKCPGVLMNRAVVDQLNELAAYLSKIKGRKNLIWINRGIPSLMFPPAVGRGSTPGGAPSIGRNSLCPWFMASLTKTYDLLADAQVTTYPLDPSGAGHTGIGHLALDAFAEKTGGVAFYGDNFLDDLMVKAVDAGASYYTLSYIPPGVQYDGRYHAIGIKASRPGVHLLYRKGYSAEDPAQIAHASKNVTPPPAGGPPTDPLAIAVSPSAPPATQILFDVRVESISKPEDSIDPQVTGFIDPGLKKKPQQLTRYSFVFKLPPSQIAFADAGGGTYSGAVEFDVAAFDVDGNMVSSVSQTRMLPLTNEEYRQFIASPFEFYQQLDLPPGEFRLRLGILDNVSKKIGALEIPLTVGKRPRAVTSAIAPANPATSSR